MTQKVRATWPKKSKQWQQHGNVESGGNGDGSSEDNNNVEDQLAMTKRPMKAKTKAAVQMKATVKMIQVKKPGEKTKAKELILISGIPPLGLHPANLEASAVRLLI